MYRSQERRQGMTAAIFSLWRNWAISVGVLTVLAFLAPIVPQMWLLPIDITALFVLAVARRIQRTMKVPSCQRMLDEVSIIVLVSAVLIAVICMLSPTGGLREGSGEPFTADSPLIAILITAPSTVIVTACFLLNRREPLVCRKCKMRYGNVIEHGFIGGLYRQEWRFQTRLLMILSGCLAVVDWGYYMLQYVNVNLNRADYFYFIWLPMVIYLLSLIYLGSRYYSMWVYYCHNDEGHFVEQPGSTTLRYLLIKDGRILIDMTHTADHFPNGGVIKRFDTPVVVKLPYRESENLADAEMQFHQATGIREATIRPIYESPDNVTYRNIFHYFVFIDDEALVADSKVRGEWLTFNEIYELMQHRVMARELVSEIKRIYDVAMAWKTYDRKGHRLYDIKHYHPTFHLRDIRKWDVDYNDETWLKVSHFNEDKPFFRIRKFFSNAGQRFHCFIA